MDCSVWMTGNVATPVTFRSGESANGQKWSRAEFRLASTRRQRGQDGQWGDVGTTFVTVVAWRALADGIWASVTKGDPVIVSGRLATDQWVDRNGELQSRLTLAADAVGHDLTRGRTRFSKNPAPPSTAPADAATPPTEVRAGVDEGEAGPPNPWSGDADEPAPDEYVPFDAFEGASALG
nr:single-stranded DNA-binding protein [Propionibacterium sp.]